MIAVSDFFRFCAALFRSRTALAAENLFLRKQLVLFQERGEESQINQCRRPLSIFQACSVI
jgi:hypothetical protein